jgi:hypothetical protein
MRSLKTRGGLTRGSGFSKVQRAIWLLSMPICSNYNLVMQDFSYVSFTTSDQHKDFAESRITRDNNTTGQYVLYGGSILYRIV